MNALAAGLSYFDLHFTNRPRVIATAVLAGAGGVAIVDPGPSSTLPTLRAGLARAGISVSDVTALLLTHIHLDHAGASGTLVAENPRIRVYVHEAGAPHMADPSKLIASATRLWGADMDRLWGRTDPVPAASMAVLRGGERIEVSGRAIDVAYTPGHASHHVSYFIGEAGVAMVGDTGGVCLSPGSYVLPPTPPPDIDLDAWCGSLDRIRAWRPASLFMTHFGPSGEPAPHLADLRDRMEAMAGFARASLARDESDEAREGWFVEQVRTDLKRRLTEAEAGAYETAARTDLSWRGLARYWRKRGV